VAAVQQQMPQVDSPHDGPPVSKPAQKAAHGMNASLCGDRRFCHQHCLDRGDGDNAGPSVVAMSSSTAQVASRIRSDVRYGLYAAGHDGDGRVATGDEDAAENEATRIVIHGHQFKDRAHGSRHSRSLTFQLPAVQLQARVLWEDFCEHEPCPVYLLEQQPLQRGPHFEVHFIVELDRRHEAYRYLLADAIVDGAYVPGQLRNQKFLVLPILGPKIGFTKNQKRKTNSSWTFHFVNWWFGESGVPLHSGL